MRSRWLRRIACEIAARRRPSAELVLLRAMCHELRPPVSVLGSLVRALGDEPGDRSADRHAEIVQLAAEHAEHLQSMLRQASAMTQGMTAVPGSGRQVPLHRILPATVAVVPTDRLSLEVTPAAGCFEVDAQHTRQVLTNLLENAVRHGPERGLIRLQAGTAGRALRLTVADEGRLTDGLTESLRRRRPPMDMTGLGLWIVRHLVAQAGGTVRARSLRSGGVAVDVVLPGR